jgi:hypothetical protein
MKCEIRMGEGQFAIILSMHQLLRNYVFVSRIAAVLIADLPL